MQANAYLTPAGARGLTRHADEHDVLVLQSSGHKSWDVAGLGAITASPGDVLYLPAHTEHSAEAQGEVSLHITVGILRVTYGHVLRRLLDRLDGVDLDAPLPVGFAAADRADALHDELTRQLPEVAAAVARVDARDVVQHEQRRATRWRSPLPRGQLQSILMLDRIDASTVVAARADHPAEVVDADGGRVALVLIDRTVEAPSTARAALEHLLRGEDTKVGELPGLSDASRMVLVRRLVREGWLRVVNP